MTYEENSLKDLLNVIRNRSKPLAFYYFGFNKKIINHILRTVSFGSGAINNTIMNLTERNLSFGGVGDSGIGNYHGKYSFLSYSHQKSVLFSGEKEI